MSAAAAKLETLERWMQAVVMHPEGADAGLRARPARRLVPMAAADPENVVLPSKALTSVERLELYAHMYYARLIEILEAEYPTTRQILGAHEFAVSCRKFIARNPSRSRTLNRLSEKFPDFLARNLPRGHRNNLAADVARIERAMEDVFDERRAEPMTAAQFAAIGADQWERVRLSVNPALRLLTLRYPANDYMNAVRSGKKPRIPRPRKTFAIVYRRGYSVFRRDQAPEQFRLLAALASGRVLAAAVRASIGGRSGSADRLAAKLGAWFREWAAAGIFTGAGSYFR
ncbi:MAG TPA: DNA-binding domain-containing protein, partial [Steroidobacteraceae bacterium]